MIDKGHFITGMGGVNMPV